MDIETRARVSSASKPIEYASDINRHPYTHILVYGKYERDGKWTEERDGLWGPVFDFGSTSARTANRATAGSWLDAFPFLVKGGKFPHTHRGRNRGKKNRKHNGKPKEKRWSWRNKKRSVGSVEKCEKLHNMRWKMCVHFSYPKSWPSGVVRSHPHTLIHIFLVLCKTFAFYNSLHIQFGWVFFGLRVWVEFFGFFAGHQRAAPQGRPNSKQQRSKAY